MAKKIKLEITEAQLIAIISLTDDASAMLGGSDSDTDWIKHIMLIDITHRSLVLPPMRLRKFGGSSRLLLCTGRVVKNKY